jgi:hypothetical protein
MHNAEAKGKQISHGNAAYYALQHCKFGRRAVGHSSCNVYGTRTQLTGRSRLESLEMVVATNEETGGEIFELHDVLSCDQEDPSTKAARKMDWEDFYAALSPRDQAIVLLMIEGKSVSGMARKLKVSDWTVRNCRKNLGLKILEHMGPDILIQVQRSPKWKCDLAAVKEKLACRHERAH